MRLRRHDSLVRLDYGDSVTLFHQRDNTEHYQTRRMRMYDGGSLFVEPSQSWSVASCIMIIRDDAASRMDGGGDGGGVL
jgi:hypothetical protein